MYLRWASKASAYPARGGKIAVEAEAVAKAARLPTRLCDTTLTHGLERPELPGANREVRVKHGTMVQHLSWVAMVSFLFSAAVRARGPHSQRMRSSSCPDLASGTERPSGKSARCRSWGSVASTKASIGTEKHPRPRFSGQSHNKCGSWFSSTHGPSVHSTDAVDGEFLDADLLQN